jgi:hypothetical protein
METLQRTANRGSVPTGYDIDNSLKLEADNTEYLTRTPSSAGNEKTWTWSGWIKYTSPTVTPQTIFAGGTDSGSYGAINFRIDAGQMELNTASVAMRTATQKFRDPAAWYHFVVAMDTTQSTADDRIKIYVNGSQITDFSVSNNPPQDTDTGVNANELQTIGRRSHADDRYFSGYIAEVHLVDGTALTPTSFGEFDSDSGIWKPKKYTGSYGTNGYYLKFNNSSSLGTDSSGNGNNFTLNNITAADQATDTCTNNFAVLNTLHNVPNTTRKEGATTTVKTNNGWRTLVSTLGVSSGKWYFELSAGSEYQMIGVAGDAVYGGGSANENYLGALTGSLGYYGNSATFFQDGADKSPTNVSSYTTDDIVGLALDVDNGKAYFHKNGTYQNLANPNTSSNGYTITGDAPYFLSISIYQQTDQCEVNYGGYHVYSISSGNSDANGYGNFEYAPPSGYYALCTKNLAEYG